MLVGRSPDAGMATAERVRDRLVAALRSGGMEVPDLGHRLDGGLDGGFVGGLLGELVGPVDGSLDGMVQGGPTCPVLAWAGSGAMWLTGWPDGPPQWPTGDVIGALQGAAAMLAGLAGTVGADLGPVDVGALLTGRAAARGTSRRGGTSVGGRSRILRAADGWLAVTLARPDDVGLLPVLEALASDRRRAPARPEDQLPDGEGHVEPPLLADEGIAEGVPDGIAEGVPGGVSEEVWARLERLTRCLPAAKLMADAQLLGLAAAEVGTREVAPAGASPPWSIIRAGEPVVAGRRRPRVVDFSALWAGPLCAHLLGRCGAEVVKVEDCGRPDAARQGDPSLFEQLHAGHEHVTVDFRSGAGHRVLGELVDVADVVIEASRPRALGQLGLRPEDFLASRPGRTWVSITARGRSGSRSNWVAFGDDAAAGGGLVAGADPRGPAFCADAVADPITGLFAANAALASIASGGGHLLDCSMTAASAFVNRFGACPGVHLVEERGGDWFVSHDGEFRRVERPRLTHAPSH